MQSRQHWGLGQGVVTVYPKFLRLCPQICPQLFRRLATVKRGAGSLDAESKAEKKKAGSSWKLPALSVVPGQIRALHSAEIPQ
jgi:hypothetical protein